MILGARTLDSPDAGALEQLLHWRPRHGLISLYISIDPGDRSDAWRTVVRKGLSQAVRTGGRDRHELRGALKATADRIQRGLAEGRTGQHRGLIGFVEVATAQGEEHWFATQIALSRTEVGLGSVPRVHRLLELLDDGAPLGVATVSSERIRLLDWRLGHIERLHAWRLAFFAGDWKEQKAQRPRDPAHGEAVSSSGRDQYDQRLEATRERFAARAGRLARAEARGRRWRRVLVFGDQRYSRKFCDGLGKAIEVTHIKLDLIAEPISSIERRVEEILPSLNRDRETALVSRIKELAYAEGRSSLGVQETMQALEEGRVQHLVYDAGRGYEAGDSAAPRGLGGPPAIEHMVKLALSTGAAITPVEAESASGLAEQEGVAALLRY